MPGVWYTSPPKAAAGQPLTIYYQTAPTRLAQAKEVHLVGAVDGWSRGRNLGGPMKPCDKSDFFDFSSGGDEGGQYPHLFISSLRDADKEGQDGETRLLTIYTVVVKHRTSARERD